MTRDDFARLMAEESQRVRGELVVAHVARIRADGRGER